MALTKVIGAGLGTVTEDQVFGGATPTVTIGDAGAEDAKIVFDGNAQDYHIGLDDSADTLVIGKGSALGTTTAMSFDANGIITMPLQPAFLVQPASAQNNIAVGTAVAVALGTERYDQNADFASNTFTAPVTGKYMLCANLFLIDIDSAANYYQVSIVTSNRTYYWSYDGASSDEDPNRLQGQVNVVADMDASDTATVAITISSGGSAQTDIAVESYFSGALIC